MNSAKMDPQKKKTLLVILATVCLTMSGMHLLEGVRDHDRWRYTQSLSLFITGIVFIGLIRYPRKANSRNTEEQLSGG